MMLILFVDCYPTTLELAKRFMMGITYFVMERYKAQF